MIRKNKKTKKRINRKLKSLNNEMKLLELLMNKRQQPKQIKQHQQMPLVNYGSNGYGGNGAHSLPTNSVSSSLVHNDLKNEVVVLKDKLLSEIQQNEQHKANIENKRLEDNEANENRFDENNQILYNGLLYVAHLKSRINEPMARISTRSKTPETTRSRTEHLIIDHTPIMASTSATSLQTPLQPIHLHTIPSTVDIAIEKIVNIKRPKLSPDEMKAVRVENANKANATIARRKAEKLASQNADL